MSESMLLPDAAPEFGGDLDFWATPPSAYWPIRPYLSRAVGERRVQVLEPAAGRGGLLNLAVALDPMNITAVELDQQRHADLARDWGVARTVCTDFLTLDVRAADTRLDLGDIKHPLCVLMNPPFTRPRKTIALEFVQHALELAAPSRGIVCALLQHDWATGVAWGALHDRHAASLYPLRRRPKFNARGTGTRPCSWFLWDLAQPKREWRVIG